MPLATNAIDLRKALTRTGGTRAKFELGLALMPDGQRKQGLKAAATFMFSEDFSGLINLPYRLRRKDVAPRRSLKDRVRPKNQ